MVPEREDGAVTQGELIRQEQEAGIVPVSQTMSSRGVLGDGEDGELDDGDNMPHARGPDMLGAEDIGLVDGKKVEMHIGGGSPEVRVDKMQVERVEEASKARAGQGRSDAAGGDEDIVLTDADGKTEEQVEEKADASGANVGPDASDTAVV